jgi:hypothetical protein
MVFERPDYISVETYFKGRDRQMRSPRQREFDERERLMDGVKELVNRVRIILGRRIPVNNKSEINPAVFKEHAAGSDRIWNPGVSALPLSGLAHGVWFASLKRENQTSTRRPKIRTTQ